MKIEPPKSLFDYVDEEWASIELCLMRGAGRRYKDPVEALAAVVSLKKAREVIRKWFIEKEAILSSHKEKLIKEVLTKNKREYLTPREQKEVETEVSAMKHTFNGQEEYRFKLPEKDKEFAELYYLGYNGSDFILDELGKAEETEGEEKDRHLNLSQEKYDYCKKNKEIMPGPIEDYFLKNRNKPSAEEIREWYLENKIDIKIKTLRPPSRAKWELGIWGYIVLGVLIFLLVCSLGPMGIILFIVEAAILIGLWMLWFGVLKRSFWELIALYIFLAYIFSRLK